MLKEEPLETENMGEAIALAKKHGRPVAFMRHGQVRMWVVTHSENLDGTWMEPAVFNEIVEMCARVCDEESIEARAVSEFTEAEAVEQAARKIRALKR